MSPVSFTAEQDTLLWVKCMTSWLWCAESSDRRVLARLAYSTSMCICTALWWEESRCFVSPNWPFSLGNLSGVRYVLLQYVWSSFIGWASKANDILFFGGNEKTCLCVTVAEYKRMDRFLRKFAHKFLGAKYCSSSLMVEVAQTVSKCLTFQILQERFISWTANCFWNFITLNKNC